MKPTYTIENHHGQWMIWRTDSSDQKACVEILQTEQQANLVLAALDGSLNVSILDALARLKTAIDTTAEIANELEEAEPKGSKAHIEALDEISNSNALEAYNTLAAHFYPEVRPYATF